jgi:excisionase family DNA binding protein
MNSDWLTLSEVATQLGVHPSTVRNWADAKLLPVHRTQGGHRRFKRKEMELWSAAQEVPSKDLSANVVQSALRFTRFQLSEGRLKSEDWYSKLNEEAREEYRSSGRHLMQALTAAMSAKPKAAQAEARSVGYQYATLGRRHGLTYVEAASAYLFFRAALQEAMLKAFEAAAVGSPYAWSGMSRKVNSFADQVLLSLLETYRSLVDNSAS